MESAVSRLPTPRPLVVAVALDTGVVSSVVAGVLATLRRLMHTETRAWADVITIIAMGAVYGVTLHRGRGTVGEVLTGTAYGGARPPGGRAASTRRVEVNR